MDAPYHIGFVAHHPPAVADLYQCCLDTGFTPTSGGDTDTVDTYEVGRERITNADPEAATEAIEDAQYGSIYFWTQDGLRVRVDVTEPETDLERRYGVTGIGFQTSDVHPRHHVGTADPRISSIIELVAALSNLVEPDFVWSAVVDGELAGVPEFPPAFPLLEDLDRLSWITVLGPDLVEEVGGRDHVLDTPAVETRVLDTGSILLVLADHPVQPETDHVAAATAHLLEDERDSSTASLDLLDPFATLDAGEYGTDVCLHRDDISTSFPNEDLELIRVERDQRGDLRRIEDGRFVRNVVEDAPEDEMAQIKAMLGDVPPEVDDEDLYVSTLLLEAIPPEFVRLDDPDGQNVVTRVMDLDIETNKVDLLVSLGRAAETRGDGAIDAIEGALDTLGDVENVDGVEDWIDEHLLL